MDTTKNTHTEQTRKRAENRYSILRTLQSVSSMKRTELADHCGIRKSSVTSLVDELLEKKWVRLENPDRPRSPLQMNENTWRVITAELDTGRVMIGEVDLVGNLIEVDEYKSAAMNTKKGMIDGLIKHLKDKVSKTKYVLGIALSVPGVIDPNSEKCISAINLPNFNDVPLKKYLTDNFDCPVVIENDVRSSLYSSLYLDKRPQALDTAIYMDMTSGVGSAILVHGSPIPGSNGAAGEIGHLKAGEEGRLCRCGQKDCLETYSSIPVICEKINKKLNLKLESSEDITEAAKKHPEIIEILNEATSHIARPLSAMMAALDPEVVILGNQPRSFYELVTPGLKSELESRLNGPATRSLKIEIAKEHSSMRGVAALMMNQIFSALY